MCASVCECASVSVCNWFYKLIRGPQNKYWYFLSGNLDFGLEKSWKNHGTFFWYICGNPVTRPVAAIRSLRFALFYYKLQIRPLFTIAFLVSNILPCHLKRKLSFWRNFHHCLHQKLPKWQFLMHSAAKISSEWPTFSFQWRTASQNDLRVLVRISVVEWWLMNPSPQC